MPAGSHRTGITREGGNRSPGVDRDSPCVPGSAAPPGLPGRAERGLRGPHPEAEALAHAEGRPSARRSPLAPCEVSGPWRRHSSMDLSTLGKRDNPWGFSAWAQFNKLGLLLLLLACSLLANLLFFLSHLLSLSLSSLWPQQIS